MRDQTESITVARGFLPIVGRAPRILVLGSLPGRASIDAGEYYARPENAFWTIMGALCAAGPTLAYARRLAALKRAGIALWDVLHAAERPGSLDADIVPESRVPNDIAGLIARHPSIGLVAFNGQTAARLFRRYVEASLTRADIERRTLPSTSPAYASLPKAAKLERWRTVLRPYLASV